MEIHCLGTAGYHPNERCHTSCYFLPADGVVLDAGTGLFRITPLIQTQRLDILLSHSHLDHVAGLTFLLDILHQRPVATVVVWGQQTKLTAVREHLFNEHIFPVPLRVQWQAIDGHTSFRVGATAAVQVDWRPQEHPGGSVAFRLRWTPPQESKSKIKTLVYATDTVGDCSAEARAWMQYADLLMHESYFHDDQQHWAVQTGHCWTSRAAGIARAANVKHLLLTHSNPLDPEDTSAKLTLAAAQFPNTTLARDGDVIRF